MFLRENGYDIPDYKKKSSNYVLIPENSHCEYCSLEFKASDNSCDKYFRSLLSSASSAISCILRVRLEVLRKNVCDTNKPVETPQGERDDEHGGWKEDSNSSGKKDNKNNFKRC